MTRYREEHFVADGYERAVEATLPQIQAEVKAEYAERLASAGWYRRLWLRVEMRREVWRRLARIAPPWALYFSE